MQSAAPPKILQRLTAIYAPLRLVAIALWRAGEIVPPWIPGIVLLLALPLGIAWIDWLRKNDWQPRLTASAVGTAIYISWWQLALFALDALEWHAARASLAQMGMLGLFLIGLAWVVWVLEYFARRIEQRRIEQQLRRGLNLTRGPSEETAAGIASGRIWNPLDPQAWYYGRGSRKL